MASLFAARRSQGTGYPLLATGCSVVTTGCRRAMTLANESFAHATHLTYFQSLSPLASVNESFASANDSLPLATHLPCFLEDGGVTKVTPLPTSVESITTPHSPRGKIFLNSSFPLHKLWCMAILPLPPERRYMPKINVGRWILCGVIGGIAGDIISFITDGWLFAPRWAAAMQILGRPSFSGSQITWFNAIGLAVGLVSLWIYVGIRPRFGPGPKTAIYAALAVWIVGFLLPNAAFMYVPHLFPNHLTLFTTIGNLVSCLVGTLVGAALYKEA
jgi:hypothetical protein